MNGKCKALREGETRGFSLRARNILASFLDCGTEPGDGSRDIDTTKVFLKYERETLRKKQTNKSMLRDLKLEILR